MYFGCFVYFVGICTSVIGFGITTSGSVVLNYIVLVPLLITLAGSAYGIISRHRKGELTLFWGKIVNGTIALFSVMALITMLVNAIQVNHHRAGSVNLSRSSITNESLQDMVSRRKIPRHTWELNLEYNQLTDLSSLQALTTLNELNLGHNQIRDLTPLQSLTRLRILSLHDNQISNIKPLESLTGLTSLNLVNNNISDVSPLKPLTRLETLFLEGNQIDYTRTRFSQIDAKVYLDKSTFEPGETMKIIVTGITDEMLRARAVIAVYQAGAPQNTWTELNTGLYLKTAEREEIEHVLNLPADEYELRLFKNGNFNDAGFIMSVPFSIREN